MKKILVSAILGFALCAGSYAADVVVKIRPPALRVEHRPARPGPDYVWVGGYHRWDGKAYVWVPGEWQRPPRARAPAACSPQLLLPASIYLPNCRFVYLLDGD